MGSLTVLLVGVEVVTLLWMQTDSVWPADVVIVQLNMPCQIKRADWESGS